MSRNVASRRVDVALACRARGLTQDQACAAAKIARRTLVRWESSDWFRARIEDVRRAMFSQASDQATGLATTALDTLAELLDAGMPPAVRLGAARTIVEAAGRLREISTLAQRLADLEARLTVNVLNIGGGSALPWSTPESVEADVAYDGLPEPAA